MRGAQWWIAQRRRVVAAALLVAAVLAPGLPRLATDNSPEAFFVRDTHQLQLYRRAADAFGDLATLRIVLGDDGVWTAAGLAWLADLERRAPKLRGVVAAAGLYGHHRRQWGGWPPTDPEALRRRALADSLDRNAGLVGSGGDTVTVLLALRDLSVGERRRLLADLAALLDEAPPGITASAAGLPVLNAAFDSALQRMASWLFPALVALAVALLAIALGSAADVGRPLAFVAWCLLVVLGAMGWAGARLNMVLILLVPLLFVIALATAVHVVARHRQLLAQGLAPLEATLRTYEEKAWPVVWTGLTTGVGFGSFATSSVPPLRSLGLWTAGGIAVLTLAALTLLPALLSGPRRVTAPALPWERRIGRWGRRWGGAAFTYRRWLAGAFAALAVLSLLGLARLRQETSVATYLAPRHPVRLAIQQLEAGGVGAATADLIIALPPGAGDFRGGENLAALGRLVAELRAEPLVLGAVSAADMAGWLGRGEEAPGEPGDPFQRVAVAMVLAEDGESARVSMMTPLADFQQLDPLFTRARRRAESLWPEAEVWVTGRYPLVLAAQRTLYRALLTSLALTFACVAATFALLLGSLRLTVFALLPNLLPPLAALGAMGWLGVPVDSTTVVVAAVVLGLAVDDTLHFLAGLRSSGGGALAMGQPSHDGRGCLAAAISLERTAFAHVLTSVLLVAGFAVCSLSVFVPVARFGALTALALAVALAADLTLTPALFAEVGGGAKPGAGGG